MGVCFSSISRSRDRDGVSGSEGSLVGSSFGRWKKIGSSKRLDDDSLQKKKLGCVSIERELNGISGRMFINGASEVACLYTQQGKKGANQDTMIVWQNFCSRSDTIFCGVFDGHGPYGHLVAKKVRDLLPLLLCTQWKGISKDDLNSCGNIKNAPRSTNTEETAPVSMDDEWCKSLEVVDEKVPEMYLPLKQAMLKAFKLMDKELKLNPTLDCFCSGSTAVTLIKQGLDLVIGNVGDSRAVLATRDKDNSLIAIQLTVDLKPDLPREAARINQYKGRVFALQDEPEVARVWLPNSDSPGLAMARAFGDFCLKDFGLISVPDVYYRLLSERDEFIILASDGVWDVLSNKEAVDVVASAPNRATAARALVDSAARSWRLKYPTSKIDDCAVVCVFVKHPSTANEVLETDATKTSVEQVEKVAISNENSECSEFDDGNHEHSGTLLGNNEIVPVPESKEDKLSSKIHCTSRRSLAECLSTAEDDEWSALEGVTRVNSLLSLPRFLSSGKRATSRKKWL